MPPGRRFVLLLLLVLSAPAQAQVGAVDPHRAPAVSSDLRHPVLPDFSMQQRAAIFHAVSEQNSPPEVPFDVQVGIGTILPETAEMGALPEPVARIPASAKYKYAVGTVRSC
jgi:hypothetical protein